ncbi:MlaE family lipid ABC transporter permease subunit [Sulfurimonas sp. HSL-1716]|uniref:MlaE family lipid ABC transporter permease subunit n=1 Tax=Hydrocurvibacter sulfurireducens TaxID=3131937 RepID=UPI0031F8F52E
MSSEQRLSYASDLNNSRLEVILTGEISLSTTPELQRYITNRLSNISELDINLENVLFLDTAGAIYINGLTAALSKKNIRVSVTCKDKKILRTLGDIKNIDKELKIPEHKSRSFVEKLGEDFYLRYEKFAEFLNFFGRIVYGFFYVLRHISSLRYKEIFFEINENAIRAFSIVALTSFLVGIVIAYQSAFQLKIYGANIFIIDMLGLSILREIAPLITAIVIAGRSGSAFTAQIGAMKITEELDAMRTMGFDPIIFLVLPRIIALMIMLPMLIFLSDVMGIVGGMLVAKLDLGISTSLFLDRFNEVIAVKHFYVGISKGPFFAFLIASIGVFRGMMVKDDTQSIGLNTTKSVVESIFAVIVCDAVFSIIYTNLGI